MILPREFTPLSIRQIMLLVECKAWPRALKQHLNQR